MRKLAAILISLVVGAALVTGGPASASTSPQLTTSVQQVVFPHYGLGALRAATDQFHSLAVAEQHGYALLTDAKGIACIDMPGTGGMGVHWADSTLVADPAIVPNQPEALVYAPDRDGTLRLAAVEYVVLASAWDANHSSRPVLFGHRFDFTAAPNRYGLPDFYSLHVWAWQNNPAGTFAMWNPLVRCP